MVGNKQWNWLYPVLAVVMTCGGGIDGFVVIPDSSSSLRIPCGLSSPLAALSSTPVAFSDTSIPETFAPQVNSFAAMVERGMKERFGEENEKDFERVLESWRLAELGYEHYQYVGDEDQDPGETSLCRQHAHSFVRDLQARTFWDDRDGASFPWIESLEGRYAQIREEFQRVTSDVKRLQKEGNNIWAGALSDDASSYGEGWKTLVLMDRGRWDPVNVQLFPKTSQILRECDIPVTEVFFASMEPHSKIKVHSDFTNFVLTSHLALQIPCSGQNKCRLTIGDETRQWINGKVMVFDTSIMHSAVNESDETRYILMMRLWHPHLTPIEREALQYLYDCLENPDMVHTDPDIRRMAEEKAKAAKAFPMDVLKKQRSNANANAYGFGTKTTSTTTTSSTSANKKKKKQQTQSKRSKSKRK